MSEKSLVERLRAQAEHKAGMQRAMGNGPVHPKAYLEWRAADTLERAEADELRIKIACGDRDRAEARVGELEAALQKFGTHLGSCHFVMYSDMGPENQKPCTCGFVAALSHSGEAPPQDAPPPGFVKIEPDDPRYCHDPDPEHPDHNFTYEYERNGERVTGSYFCTRANRLAAADPQGSAPAPQEEPAWSACEFEKHDQCDGEGCTCPCHKDFAATPEGTEGTT